MNTSQKLMFGTLTALLALLPFHTPVTVLLASNFEHLYVWSSWKEVLILIAALIGFYYFCRDKMLRQKFLGHRYNQIAIAYIILLTIYLLLNLDSSSTLVAYALNVRFLVVFMLAQIVARYWSDSFRVWAKVLLAVALISAVWGIVQVSILPPEALTTLGYDPIGVDTSGIPPAIHKVSANSDLYRAQAGLRGPNVLGAFLILPILLCAWAYRTTKNKLFILAAAVLVVCLYLTYSRSALLALVIAVVMGVFLFTKQLKKRATILLLVAGFIIMFAAIVFSRTTYFQDVVLHRSDEVTTAQSNEGHIEHTQQALSEVVEDPLGEGLGSAGPASALTGQGRIAENYFLQIGQEIGWFGTILLLAFHGFLGYELWRWRKNSEAVIVFVAFIALSLTNLVLHTWSDEAVSLSFFLLAGALLSSSTAQKQSKNFSASGSERKRKNP